MLYIRISKSLCDAQFYSILLYLKWFFKMICRNTSYKFSWEKNTFKIKKLIHFTISVLNIYLFSVSNTVTQMSFLWVLFLAFVCGRCLFLYWKDLSVQLTDYFSVSCRIFEISMQAHWKAYSYFNIPRLDTFFIAIPVDNRTLRALEFYEFLEIEYVISQYFYIFLIK